MKRKERIPRKLKKVINDVMIADDGRVVYSFRFRIRRYPRTKWVIKCEKGIRKLWIEMRRNDERLEYLKEQLKRLDTLTRELSMIRI